MKPSAKWSFAIGTTSRVPSRHNLHYLIADFDKEPDWYKLSRTLSLARHCFFQRTEHGIHMYTDLVVFEPREALEQIGADRSWIKIGQERGYWFLADKSQIYLPWPVERMVISIADIKKNR